MFAKSRSLILRVLPENRLTSAMFLAVFALGLLVRLVYVLVVILPAVSSISMAETEAAAANLLRTGTLGNPYNACETGPTAHLSPVYPMLLAGIYGLFGIRSLTSLFLQAIFASACAALTFALLPAVGARLGLSRVASWTAAFTLAAFPIMPTYEAVGDWEQPLTGLLLVLMLLQFLRLQDEGWNSWRDAAATGMLAGVACLTTASLLPAILAMTVIAALSRTSRSAAAQSMAGVGLLLAVMVVTIAPWVIRNTQVLGSPILLRSNFGLELALGNNPEAKGYTATDVWKEKARHPNVDGSECARVKSVGEIAYMKERQQEAMRWIWENPADFVTLSLKRARIFWFPDTQVYGDRQSLSTLLRAGLLGLISALALLGLILLARLSPPRFWMAAAAIIAPTIAYAVTHVDLRYRVPIHPLTVLLACQAAFLILTLLWARIGHALKFK